MLITNVTTLKTGRFWRKRWPWKQLEAEKLGVRLCGVPSPHVQGKYVINDCLKLRGHAGKHKDLWKDTWRT